MPYLNDKDNKRESFMILPVFARDICECSKQVLVAPVNNVW